MSGWDAVRQRAFAQGFNAGVGAVRAALLNGLGAAQRRPEVVTALRQLGGVDGFRIAVSAIASMDTPHAELDGPRMVAP